MKIEIRQATVSDAALIHHYITELAIYEKAQHEVIASVADIERSLFAADSPAHGLICLIDGLAVGFAIYFYSYSTWLGRKGMYLEDLYISPEHRGSGAGKTMLRHLAGIARETGCGRLEWSVLDWNEPAIQFYLSLGASPQDEWIRYRLAGDTLTAFARGD
ncbi:GNAT family N-acetyltransferase [Undibacterium parvum]|uniref:GNAT family N-acetyltransferase n=2 Tax=Undibacterium TaxID=401469 RepID=A0A6M4A9C8_9BURK|nr:GNAT family N-acetyltransferase [Undibacterium parvum]AZP12359.1 GNAT family N-acetyltransferase [Undibacterium parvum]QJQ06639.1 GNAT family N-acetyltransferase [Undibacterium piscinae]